MRIPSKPSTARCTLELYVRYLLAQPQNAGCSQMAEILGTVSHDSINRFLERERYEAKDLFDFLVEREGLVLKGGVLSGDDTLLEKPYSQPYKSELLGYYWNNKQKKVMWGLPLITLYYTSPNGLKVPINYRLYDKREEKSKNQYLQEMLKEVRAWGIEAIAFTSDTWYASKSNLHQVKNAQWGFLVGVAKNRQVRLEGGKYQRIEELTIPEQGLLVYLKGVGTVKAFCQRFKDESCRYYLLYFPNKEKLEQSDKEVFDNLRSIHWGIECFHRASKQLCGIQRFRVRRTESIRTHVFCSLRAFVVLELEVWHQQIANWYSLQRNLYQEVARRFILQQSLC